MKDKQIDSYWRLQHILKAIISIENFINDYSEGKFLSDSLISSAVLFQFSMIGEAIIYVDESILNKYEYPWYKIRAFRILIAHEYFNIKLSAVWRIIKEELPKLKALVELILKNEF